MSELETLEKLKQQKSDQLKAMNFDTFTLNSKIKQLIEEINSLEYQINNIKQKQ